MAKEKRRIPTSGEETGVHLGERATGGTRGSASPSVLEENGERGHTNSDVVFNGEGEGGFDLRPTAVKVVAATGGDVSACPSAAGETGDNGDRGGSEAEVKRWVLAPAPALALLTLALALALALALGL
jgi:hypothetical protein